VVKLSGPSHGGRARQQYLFEPTLFVVVQDVLSRHVQGSHARRRLRYRG
jgi:hypothetical protein